MKKILLSIMIIVFVLGSYIAGFYYCKQQVIKGNNRIVEKDIDRIAVVNLDEGINSKNGKLVYSNQFLKYTKNYNNIGLNEAQKGIEDDRYAAYIIIPSNFSYCIESINSTPQKVKVEYIINPNLTDKNRLDVEKELGEFKEILSSNAACVYLSSILNEFHNVQDSASVIMEHDDKDLNNIQNILPDEIFMMIDFSEIKECENKIENVDLTSYINENSTEVENITSTIDNGLATAEKEYQKINQQYYKDVSLKMTDLKDIISDYNPLKDDDGNDVYQDGVDNLDNLIDEHNSKVGLENDIDIEGIKKTIYDVAKENVTEVLDETQQNADKQLKGIQDKNIRIIKEEKTDFNNKTLEFYNKYNGNIEGKISEYTKSSQAINEEIGKSFDLLNTIRDKRKEIDKSEKNNYTKEEVLNYIEQIANGNFEEIKKEIESDESDNFDKTKLYKYIDFIEVKNIEILKEQVTALRTSATTGFDSIRKLSEDKIPQLTDADFMLPEVKEIYIKPNDEDNGGAADTSDNEIVETEATNDVTEEVIDSTEEIKEEKVSIDVADNIDIEKKINESVQKQDEYIQNFASEVNGEYEISQIDIKDIIHEQIVGKIEEENEKRQLKYSVTKEEFETKVDEYDIQITGFNPFKYIKKEDIKKHKVALSGNITALEKAMNNKNAEYLKFVNQVYQTANENISILQKDMQTANDTSKKKLNDVITKLKKDKKTISEEDDEILESFSKKLAYSRLGSLENTKVYKFIASPIESLSKIEGKKTSENEKNETLLQLNYKWIILRAVALVLVIITFNLIVKIIKIRKDLKELNNE